MSTRWSGRWISPEARTLDPLTSGLHGGPRNGSFSRSLFRRTFELRNVPAHAPARLTADSRYVLWVNGQDVGRGPARSQPSRQRYDAYDLAPYLVAGTNAVAVLVTYYGQATSFWQPAPAGSSSDAVLVFEARLSDRDGDQELVVSDAEWRVQRSTAWSLPGSEGGSLEGVPVEVYDARELPRGWRDVAFDDSAWARAAVVAGTHIGGLAESRPPTYPFGRLLPRGMSHQVGQRVSPAAVLDCSSHPAPRWTTDHPARRVREVLLADTVTTAPAELPATFEVGPGRVQHLAVDFGRIVAGFVELDVDAPAGTVVELHYREKAFRPERSGGTPELSDPATGARYIARGGSDSFAAFELNGLRYVHLAVHADQEASVSLSRLEVRDHLYPRTGSAYFRSDDP